MGARQTDGTTQGGCPQGQPPFRMFGCGRPPTRSSGRPPSLPSTVRPWLPPHSVAPQLQPPAASAGVSRIVVIGGGVGGLAAAARLASAGHRVTLLEQAPEVGERRASSAGASGPATCSIPGPRFSPCRRSSRTSSRTPGTPSIKCCLCASRSPDVLPLAGRDSAQPARRRVRDRAGARRRPRIRCRGPVAAPARRGARIEAAARRPFLEAPFAGPTTLARAAVRLRRHSRHLARRDAAWARPPHAQGRTAPDAARSLRHVQRRRPPAGARCPGHDPVDGAGLRAPGTSPAACTGWGWPCATARPNTAWKSIAGRRLPPSRRRPDARRA